MALELGLRYGLAQDLGYDQQINSLRYNEQMNRQAQAVAEKKAAVMADDFEYNSPMNPFDYVRVKEVSQKYIKDLGAYVNNNPDYDTNISKRVVYNQLRRNLKDNPDLNRGIQSDAGMALYRKDLAEKVKNPDLFDAGAWNDIQRQVENYNRYGNQDGEEAAKKFGLKAFQYVQPKDFVDLDKQGLEYGSKIKGGGLDVIPAGGTGGYKTRPNEKYLSVVAEDFYVKNKRQMDIRAASLGYKNPKDYAKNLIRPGIETPFNHGDINGDRNYQLAVAKFNAEKVPAGPGNYQLSFVKPEQGAVNGDLMDKVFGNRPQYQISNRDQTKFIDFTGVPLKHTGGHKYIDGKKYVEFQTDILKDDAIKNGMAYDPWGLGDFEVDKAWDDRAKIIKVSNKAGDKEVEILRYTGWRPVEVNNSTQQGIWDRESMTSKLVPAPKEDYQERQQVFQDEVGNKFVSDGKGGYLPYVP